MTDHPAKAAGEQKQQPVDGSNVHLVYHDGDGSCYCYDKDENLVPYPESWPERIAHVRTFCRARGIAYMR